MINFEPNQRVTVTDEGHYSFRDRGVVVRANATNGAWVAMAGNIHSSLRRFPPGDPREKWVELENWQCEIDDTPIPTYVAEAELFEQQSPQPNTFAVPDQGCVIEAHGQPVPRLVAINDVKVDVPLTGPVWSPTPVQSTNGQLPASGGICTITRTGPGMLQVNIRLGTDQDASRMAWRLLKAIVGDSKAPFSGIEIKYGE
jgi:hypothetical protein